MSLPFSFLKFDCLFLFIYFRERERERERQRDRERDTHRETERETERERERERETESLCAWVGGGAEGEGEDSPLSREPQRGGARSQYPEIMT